MVVPPPPPPPPPTAETHAGHLSLDSSGSGRAPPSCTGLLRMPPPDCVGKRAYHDNVVDHYEKPRNVGSLDKSSSSGDRVGRRPSAET